tara:strand:+ start:890 stop:1261 length:372 start_codon:yes stop_codon:yes gene_type:complete
MNSDTFYGQSGDEYSVNSFIVIDVSQMNIEQFKTWCYEYDISYSYSPILLDYGEKILPNDMLDILYEKWKDHAVAARSLEGDPSYYIDIFYGQTLKGYPDSNKLREIIALVPSSGWKKTYIGP